MKSYLVIIPITGIISVEVEAEDEEQAIDAAFASSDLNLDNLVEWEAHEYVVQGNVFCGSQNTVQAELIVDDEDD